MLDCRRGKNCCQLQEYLHSGWKMLWGSCTVLNWSCSISSGAVLLWQTAHLAAHCHHQPKFSNMLFHVILATNNFGSQFQSNIKRVTKLILSGKQWQGSLRQVHLILVTMSKVYSFLMRRQLRWSSIKILHNVAKYTSVVKNYQTIYKYLSDIYFFELSIFLD